MATTSPDNIKSPDAGDQYALVQDMGALADTVQSALVRRANLYKGTTAQRIAFTAATEGTWWQDTNGTKDVYVRQGGVWANALGLNSGPVASPVTVSTGWSLDDASLFIRYGSAKLRVNVTRTGGNINVNTRGDIINTEIAKIKANIPRPNATTSGSSASSGRVVTGEIWSTGEVRICAVGGSADISTGDPISLEVQYFVA